MTSRLARITTHIAPNHPASITLPTALLAADTAAVTTTAVEAFTARAHSLPHTGLLIDNIWCTSTTEPALDINAWDGSLITSVAVAGAPEVDRAVAAAREAFGSWRLSAPLDRTALLHRLADLIEVGNTSRYQCQFLPCTPTGRVID
jgi:delta 1-pyrroline-5-carboxylate dehydrogenase